MCTFCIFSAVGGRGKFLNLHVLLVATFERGKKGYVQTQRHAGAH